MSAPTLGSDNVSEVNRNSVARAIYNMWFTHSNLLRGTSGNSEVDLRKFQTSVLPYAKACMGAWLGRERCMNSGAS